jgi:hypothetical protein
MPAHTRLAAESIALDVAISANPARPGIARKHNGPTGCRQSGRLGSYF